MAKLKTLIKADIMKLKSTQIVWIHLYIPLIGLLIFLSYFSFSPWNNFSKVSSYLQVLCIAFPVLISVITSMVSEQELLAGNFRNMLTHSGIKILPFISKYIVILTLSIVSTLISVIGFYVGFSFIESNIFTLRTYLNISLILILCSVFMYNIHFFLSFRFSKSISIGIGVVESLIAALFLTGMGDGRWPFFPSSWSARFIGSLLEKYSGMNNHLDFLLNYGIGISIVITILSFVGIIIWFTKWDGKTSEE